MTRGTMIPSGTNTCCPPNTMIGGHYKYEYQSCPPRVFTVSWRPCRSRSRLEAALFRPSRDLGVPRSGGSIPSACAGWVPSARNFKSSCGHRIQAANRWHGGCSAEVDGCSRRYSPPAGSFGDGPRKSALQKMLYLSGKQKGFTWERRGKHPIPLKPFFAKNATTGVHMDGSYTRQPNDKWPVECWHSRMRVSLTFC